MKYKVGDYYKEYKIIDIKCSQPRMTGLCDCVLKLENGLGVSAKAKYINYDPIEIEVIV